MIMDWSCENNYSSCWRTQLKEPEGIEAQSILRAINDANLPKLLVKIYPFLMELLVIYFPTLSDSLLGELE